MDNRETIAVDLDFLEEIAKEIAFFSTSFVNLWVRNGKVGAELAGSGTLVHAGGKPAILTADHVLDYLPASGEVGLVIGTLSMHRLHRFTIDMSYTEKVTVARGFIESDGPDLGLLLIPTSKANEIMVYKSFYNLSKRKNLVLSSPPSLELGKWFLCGMPLEWTNNLPPEGGYQEVKAFHGICGVGIVSTEHIERSFDYLYFETKYNEAYEGPQNFRGFSGGGLWHIIVGKSEHGKPFVKKKLLSGVAFYQSEIENNCRTIICHGRKSIYSAVVDALEGSTK